MAHVLQKKYGIVILALLLALACVFAEVFVFTHLDHDCTGGDCAVCLEIQIIQNALNGLIRCGAAIILFGIAASRDYAKARAAPCLPPLSLVFLHIQSNT